MSRNREYYIEFYQVGSFVKVTAADPVTMLEASVMGPTHALPSDLQKLAIQKLENLIAKKD